MTTDESVKKRKNFNPDHQRVIDWFAHDDNLIWDTENEHVVVKPTITSLANDLGVSRQTVYNWAKTIPDFKNRVKVARENIIQEKVASMWNRVFLKACSGDMRAADMWLSNFDQSYISPKSNKAKINSKGEPNSNWAVLIRKYSQESR